MKAAKALDARERVSCAWVQSGSGELEQVTAKGDFLRGLLSIFGRK